ncbi:MAG: PAS domain-containing protein [candidate division Zixibacteria bacterium]|nr:PAS domain-containing protein [candidate division Zixibacteria bacterium]
MKTVIIGGGKGCRAIIELAASAFLKELTLSIECVVDPDANARGLCLARKLGIHTCSDMSEALALEGIELVIELTGQDNILNQLYKIIPPGMRLIDHTFAHIFWDLANAREELGNKLNEVTTLEKKIERERLFLQSLFDTIPELVVVIDANKRVLRVNDSFSRYTKISRSKAIGQFYDDLLGETELAIGKSVTSPLLEEVLETGRPRSIIWQNLKPEEVYWEETFTPILNQNLEIEAIVGTWHKITEQVRLHREIESAEVRFKSFIDSAKDWISIKDVEGKYIIVNPACAAAFNLEPDDFIDKRPIDLLDEKTASMIFKHDCEAIKANRDISYDEVFIIDGRQRHYSTVRFPLLDYRGKTIGVCTISRDITQELELSDQLAQAVKLAAVGKLAAGVAHEINNPLTGVLAYAENLLEDLGKDSPYGSDIHVIIRETLRCRDIVRNLLDFARQEKPLLKNVLPNDIVSNTLILVRKLPQFRNIVLRERMADDIPHVKCDSQQLRQVILNLMVNAVDAMKGQGEIILSTEYERAQDKCIISVADTGPGIPENLIDKIFEPFFSTKGTNGLGLAVSWGIIERHHGVIEVDTHEGGGAVFRIVLPAASE